MKGPQEHAATFELAEAGLPSPALGRGGASMNEAGTGPAVHGPGSWRRGGSVPLEALGGRSMLPHADWKEPELSFKHKTSGKRRKENRTTGVALRPRPA